MVDAISVTETEAPTRRQEQMIEMITNDNVRGENDWKYDATERGGRNVIRLQRERRRRRRLTSRVIGWPGRLNGFAATERTRPSTLDCIVVVHACTHGCPNVCLSHVMRVWGHAKLMVIYVESD